MNETNKNNALIAEFRGHIKQLGLWQIPEHKRLRAVPFSYEYEESYSIMEMIELTKNEYGGDSFSKFFNR